MARFRQIVEAAQPFILRTTCLKLDTPFVRPALKAEIPVQKQTRSSRPVAASSSVLAQQIVRLSRVYTELGKPLSPPTNMLQFNMLLLVAMHSFLIASCYY